MIEIGLAFRYFVDIPDPTVWILGYVCHVLIMCTPFIKPLHVVVMGLFALKSLKKCLILVLHPQQISLSLVFVQATKKLQFIMMLLHNYNNNNSIPLVSMVSLATRFPASNVGHFLNQEAIIPLNNSLTFLLNRKKLHAQIGEFTMHSLLRSSPTSSD